ncbi:MAG: hypothetical protein RR290_04170 [Clostridia bacterium]
MDTINMEFYEFELIYIINAIVCTKRVLMEGKPFLYSDFFEKSHYNSYMYDLTIIQKRIGYKANNDIYKLDDNEFLKSYHDYLRSSEKDFSFLFGEARKKRLSEIAKEITETNIRKEYNEIRLKLLSELDLLESNKHNNKRFRNFYNKFKRRA